MPRRVKNKNASRYMASSKLPDHRYEQFVDAYIRQTGSDRAIAKQLNTSPETISRFFILMDQRLHAVGWIDAYMDPAEKWDNEMQESVHTKPAHNWATRQTRKHRGLGEFKKGWTYIRAKAIFGCVNLGATILNKKAPHMTFDELKEPFIVGFMEDMKMIVRVTGPLNRTPSLLSREIAKGKLVQNNQRRTKLLKQYVLNSKPRKMGIY